MLNGKPVEELVQQRFSCRTYLDRPISEETRRALSTALAAARHGPLGSRTRVQLLAAAESDPRALAGLGTYGFIRGATGFIVGAVEEGPRALEDLGYVMEEIVLLATALGLGTCWLGGTFTRSRFAAAIDLKPGEWMPVVVATGYISERRGFMDRMIRRQAHSRDRLPWEELFFVGGWDLPLSRDEAGPYALPLEMVRLGPSASNKQPWRIVKDGSAWHFCLRRTPGYPAKGAGRLVKILDLQRNDVGIAMSHFALTAGDLGLRGQWVTQDPGMSKRTALTEYIVSWLEAPAAS